MGLFSRKTIITVSSVIYPMGEDADRIPDMVKTAVVTASLRHLSVPPAIKTSIFDGMGIKLSQAFSYAQNHYYAGMPTGFPKEHDSKRDAVLDLLCLEYLESLFPDDDVVLLTTEVTNTDDYRTKAQELIGAAYDYNFVTELTLSATGSVQTGATLVATGPFLDAVAHPAEIGYHLMFTNPDTSVVNLDVWYAEALFAGYELVVQRVVMEYSLNGARPTVESYEYGGSSNRLNIFLREVQLPQSGTFPAIVLKKNNVYLDDDDFSGEAWATSAAYKTSKQYGRRMGANVDTLLTMIKDNENADDIDYVFVQPGVRLDSPNLAPVKYLYNYFNRLYLLLPDNKAAWDAWAASSAFTLVGLVSKNAAAAAPAQSIHLKDPDAAASSVDMEISWRYMTYEVKSGVLAQEYVSECGDYENLITKHDYGGSSAKQLEYETTKLYLRRQIDESTYGELVIVGLRHENYVYKGHSVQSGTWAAFNDPDGDDGSGFIIPLDNTIYITLTPRERLQLAQEAMHMVFNCYVARKQKWYETGFFKFIMIVIAAVLIYFSAGTLTPYVTSIYTTLFTAFAALGPVLAAALAALLTAVIVVAVSAAVSFVAKEAGKWAAEHWGPAWGAVVQIFATIALTWGLGQILPSALPMPPSSIAETVLKVGAALVSAMSAYTEYTYAAVKDEIRTWEDYSLAKGNPLEKVNELMEEMFPDLTVAQQAILPQPETLDEFLGRTLTTTDGLTNRLTAPITSMVELTLTPRL